MQQNKLIFIQYFRAAAATMVVVFHCGLAFHNTKLFNFGGYGVNIFFFISGFIICYIFLLKPNRTAIDFIKNRSLRIYPTYFQIYFLTIIIWTVFRGILKIPVFPRGHFFYNLTLISFIDRVELANLAIPVAWTLYYEMFFYLAFAISILLFRRKAVTGIYIFALWSLLAFEFPTIYSWTLLDPAFNFQFILGFFTALIIFKKNKIVNILMAVACLTIIFTKDYNIGLVLYYTTLLTVLCFIFEKNNLLFKSKIFYLIGESSYSLYLTHTLVLGFVGIALSPMLTLLPLYILWLMLIPATFLCILVGIYNFKKFESKNREIFLKICQITLYALQKIKVRFCLKYFQTKSLVRNIFY